MPVKEGFIAYNLYVQISCQLKIQGYGTIEVLPYWKFSRLEHNTFLFNVNIPFLSLSLFVLHCSTIVLSGFLICNIVIYS